MTDTFYNGKYAVIVEDTLPVSLYPHLFINNIETYIGDLVTQSQKIKQHELDNDVFYSGILIVNDPETLKDLNPLSTYKLTDRECYSTRVRNSGVDSECKFDEKIILTSSWNLPIIANNHRTNNSLYGDLFVHRVRMLEFKTRRV